MQEDPFKPEEADKSVDYPLLTDTILDKIATTIGNPPTPDASLPSDVYQLPTNPDDTDWLLRALSVQGLIDMSRLPSKTEITTALEIYKEKMLEDAEANTQITLAIKTLQKIVEEYGLPMPKFNRYSIHLLHPDRASHFDLDSGLGIPAQIRDDTKEIFILKDESQKDWLYIALSHELTHLARDSENKFNKNSDSLDIEEGIVHSTAELSTVKAGLGELDTLGRGYVVQTWVIRKLEKRLGTKSLVAYSHDNLRFQLQEMYGESFTYQDLANYIARMVLVYDNAIDVLESIGESIGFNNVTQETIDREMTLFKQYQEDYLQKIGLQEESSQDEIDNT